MEPMVMPKKEARTLKIQQKMVNSLPPGGMGKIARKTGYSKSFVSTVLGGGYDPNAPAAKRVIEEAGKMAAMEIWMWNWENNQV